MIKNRKNEVILAGFVIIFVLAMSINIMAAEYNIKDESGKSLTGEVVSVFPSDLARSNPKLVIATENGQNMELEVKPLAVIYGSSDGKILSVTDLPIGQKVQVNYNIAKNGVSQVISIKVLSKNESNSAVQQPVEQTK